MKICIDPGHGGKDSGALGYGFLEKDINLDISLKLEKLLKENDYKVYMTRREDISLSLKKRVKLINSMGCDLNISIHNNASSNLKASGSEVIYPYESKNGKILAQYILDSLGEIGLKKRKVYYRLNKNNEDYYYIIRKVDYLSIIVECGFITNLSDNKLLSSEDFKYKIAKAIFLGILRYSKLVTSNKHWAEDSFNRLIGEGLILEKHNLDSFVTWGELSAVLNRLLGKK